MIKLSKKTGFTLAELVVAIGLLIVVVGLTIPVAKSIADKYGSDKNSIRYAYLQLTSVIHSLVTDPYLYPTGRFDNPRDYIKNAKGEGDVEVRYSGGEKFAKAFASKLNVLKSWKLATYSKLHNNAIVGASNAEVDWNGVLGYADKYADTVARINDFHRTCILTNNRVYFCIPSLTMTGNSYNPVNDRFSGDRVVVIRVYLSEDHSVEKGYYFTVNKVGKVGVLPSRMVTCPNGGLYNNGNANCKCTDSEEIYKRYNQCKLDEYLMSTD